MGQIEHLEWDEKEKSPATIRPLYPVVVREKDLVTICAAIARFLRREGYPPNTAELTAFLGADRGGVVDCCYALTKSHLIERTRLHKGGHARHALTARGWNLLGVEPMEPWRNPPSTAVIRRAVNLAASRALRYEHDALDRLRALKKEESAIGNGS